MWTRAIVGVCLGAVFGFVVCLAVLRASGLPESEFPEYQPLREELETLETHGWGFTRLVEMSWDLEKQWPRSEKFVESLLEARAPSSQWVGLNALAFHRDSASPKAVARARELADSKEFRVRFMAIGFLPEAEQEERFLRLGHEQLELFNNYTLSAGEGLRGLLDTLGPEYRTPETEKMLCEVLLVKHYRERAAEYLAKRRSRLALVYLRDLIHRLESDYRGEEDFIIRVFYHTTGFRAPFVSTHSISKEWRGLVIAAMSEYLARIPDIEDRSIALPPFDAPPNPNLAPPLPPGTRPY
jgi:hypothetical protein